MTSYSTNEFKPGLKVLLEGSPCTILEAEFVKPGKGQAFTRAKFRNFITGRVWERTLRSSETLEAADIIEFEVDYLYNDGYEWHFMRPEDTFEQFAAKEEVVGEAKNWLIEQARCTMTLWNGQPIAVLPPNFITVEVINTDPGLKGDTVSGGSKPAKLATGATIRVPLFISNGDMLRIDTRTGEYVGRSKD